MKKLLFALAILALSSYSVNAQDKEMKSNATTFSLGVEGSLPIGTFANIYSFGFGASAQAEHMTLDKLGLTLNVGYLTYSLKSAYGSGSFGLVPVLAGAKVYFTPKVYGHAQLGVSFGTSGGGGTNFTYSPGIGAYISNNIDFLLKYVGVSGTGSSFNTIAARFAYTFGK